MLKIWKQGWKKKDSSGHSQSEQGDVGSYDTPLSGASVGSSHMNQTVAIPPIIGDVETDPVSGQIERSEARRGRKSLKDISDRPLKKLKTGHDDSDTLGNHLPEIFRAESPVVSETPSEEEIIRRAKIENTIAIVENTDVASKLSLEFLTWAVELQRRRPIHSIPTPRPTSLFVVNDKDSVDRYISASLKNSCLTFKKYTEHDMGSGRHEWFELLHDVVIVSAETLLGSLLQGALSIQHIHALVICDAQNIKDQDLHPTIKVMNDFYLPMEPKLRPRILVIATERTDHSLLCDSSMLKLETIFDAKIFGLSESNRAEISSLPDRPIDCVVLYSPPLRVVETTLSNLLHQLNPTETVFRNHFENAHLALFAIGPCGSDLVWRRALRHIETVIPPDYDTDDDDYDDESMELMQTRVKIRDTIKNWIFAMPNLDLTSRGFNVTPKFLKLVEILESCKPYGDGFRGVIFVHKRVVAAVIAEFLRACDQSNSFRPSALVGDTLGDKQRREEIFRSFASGTFNLLIVTKSAEDLDIPKATVVIRFDLFESHVSYAYIRSRTRGRESHLIHMVEKGNDIHRRIISQATRKDIKMDRWIENVFTTQGNSIPPPSLHVTIDPYCSDSEDEDIFAECIQDPTTGGKIHLHDALTVIYRFAAKSDIDKVSNKPLFQIKDFIGPLATIRQHICTVNLPGHPYLGAITGPVCSSAADARRAACFQACIELFHQGLLDYRFFPLSPSKPGEIYPSALDSETKFASTRCYLRQKPSFWRNAKYSSDRVLYPIVISITGIALSHGPMVMLTWKPLPALEDFNIFSSGIQFRVHLEKGAAFRADECQLYDIHRYTLRLCRAICNKPFVCSLEKMPYFFAPLKPTWRSDQPSEGFYNVTDYIPWDLVALGAENWVIALRAESVQSLTEDMQNAVIQDQWGEFTRRYDALAIRPDLTPLSKPKDSPREAAYENLVEYCKAHRKNFEGLQDYDQPLIEVSRIPACMSQLSPIPPIVTPSSKRSAKYLIPELCAKFTIPADTFRTVLLLPSITRRIDDFLIVKELNAKFFDRGIREDLLLSAISAPSAGIEFNYERLELLGDAFLKYLSSVYVFVTKPAQHEGALHISRQKIISNRSLLHNASLAGIPPYIQAKPFVFKLWQPPGFDAVFPSNSEFYVEAEAGKNTDPDIIKQAKGELTSAHEESRTSGSTAHQAPSSFIEGSKRPRKRSKKKRDDELNTQWMGDKTVADVAEAIIGAAYISEGREGALKATKALRIPLTQVDQWSDFGRKVLAPPPNVTAELRPGSMQAVESIIGHKFARPHLLAQALTHASIQGYETTSYERLEFIGDAILDFMVIRYIYDRDSNLSPGGLTLLKGAMVSNSALAAVCVWSGLQEHLLFESYNLANNIQTYADQLRLRQAEEYEVAEKEHRTPGQYWLGIEPPKALSDVVESIIGAIYISDNFLPTGAESLFDNVLKPFYDRHITLHTLSHHPTKILFELIQSQGCQQFQISRNKVKGKHGIHCDVLVHEVILASASDTTVALAARTVSLFALDALEGDPGFLRSVCTCRTQAQVRKKLAIEKMLSDLVDEDDDLVEVENALGEDSEGVS